MVIIKSEFVDDLIYPIRMKPVHPLYKIVTRTVTAELPVSVLFALNDGVNELNGIIVSFVVTSMIEYDPLPSGMNEPVSVCTDVLKDFVTYRGLGETRNLTLSDSL